LRFWDNSDLRQAIATAIESRLLRQNAILFLGGLAAGLGGFVYHAIAGRVLGPAAYGQLASLIAFYAAVSATAVVVSIVLARHTARVIANGGSSSVRSLVLRMVGLMAIPGMAAIAIAALLARPAAAFEHLASALPIVFVGLMLAAAWQIAVPRGVLQGLQQFVSLSINLSSEMVVRTGLVFTLLAAGLGVLGGLAAVLVGLIFAFGLGIASLRERLVRGGAPARLVEIGGFPIAAVVGVVGIQLLYSQDVVLAEHYLPGQEGGIYGGVNKIASILYFLTLSVSQVLFPRVVEATEKGLNAHRILIGSAAILVGLGAGALLVFAVIPQFVVQVLYGPAFDAAVPYVLFAGLIGLAIALNNLAVQFLMALHDRTFMPILAIGCLIEAVLIVRFHAGVAEIVGDVLAACSLLLVALAFRCWVLLMRPGISQAPQPSAPPHTLIQ
jgi:O-antigen/teichoic acid export membrane protein